MLLRRVAQDPLEVFNLIGSRVTLQWPAGIGAFA
jgi:hypothetical protein